MPQMMPINWMLLMNMFIAIFIMYNIMTYFIFSNNITSNNKNNLNIFKKMTWKW